MIEIVLLSLPIICLLCCIVHLSISLWKLSTGEFSTKDIGRIQEKSPMLMVPQTVDMIPVLRKRVPLINFEERNDESLGFHMYIMRMKTNSKGYDIHNFELILAHEDPMSSLRAVSRAPFYNISNSSTTSDSDNPSIYKEKELWIMQN